MKNELTRDLLRDILDKAGMATSIDKEGDIYTVLGGDEDFPKDVYVYYLIRDGWLGIQAFAPKTKYKLTEEEMYKYLNDLNAQTRLPKAYFLNGLLHFEHWVVIESNFSKEFLRQSMKNLTGYMWHAFCKQKDLLA